MTWTWGFDGGELAVWRFDQDPSTDKPAATQAAEGAGGGWAWAADASGVRDYPTDVLDLMWDATADYYQTNLGDGTVDFTLARLIAEAAFQQIERR